MAAGMGMAIKLCHEAQLAAEEAAEDTEEDEDDGEDE